jgi:hypothetical protein
LRGGPLPGKGVSHREVQGEMREEGGRQVHPVGLTVVPAHHELHAAWNPLVRCVTTSRPSPRCRQTRRSRKRRLWRRRRRRCTRSCGRQWRRRRRSVRLSHCVSFTVSLTVSRTACLAVFSTVSPSPSLSLCLAPPVSPSLPLCPVQLPHATRREPCRLTCLSREAVADGAAAEAAAASLQEDARRMIQGVQEATAAATARVAAAEAAAAAAAAEMAELERVQEQRQQRFSHMQVVTHNLASKEHRWFESSWMHMPDDEDVDEGKARGVLQWVTHRVADHRSPCSSGLALYRRRSPRGKRR